MKYLVPLPILVLLTACDPAVQSANAVCDSMASTRNYTYTSNNMTPESCQCTMEYVRKNLSDQDWSNFIAVLNGQDPFPETSELPQSTPPADPNAADAVEPAVPTSLDNIERVTGEAEALCLKPKAG